MFEQLEPRMLLTGVTGLVNGLLNVDGTSRPDVIALTRTGDRYKLVIENSVVGRSVQYFPVASVTAVTLTGDGGDDVITVGRNVPGVLIDGGDGDDSLVGGEGNDRIFGGYYADKPGNGDTIIGNAGNDKLRGGSGPDLFFGGEGADDMIGGPGLDTVSYTSATLDLEVSLDDVANDGWIEYRVVSPNPDLEKVSEGDNVHADIERVAGGSGNDLLVGSASANVLMGKDGDDTLIGNAGLDSLRGDAGDDRLEAQDGEVDVLDGGSGNNVLDKDAQDVVA